MMQGKEISRDGRFFCGGLTASALKYIAISAMVTDHLALALYPDSYYEMPALLMHTVGRITGPVMFFFIAQGYRHTSSPHRYTARLLVFAALSYLPFIYFNTGGWPNASSWYSFNVIYTLLMGLLALRARHEVKDKALSVILTVLCFVLSIPGDWGYIAVLCILLFDYFHGNAKMQAAAYAVVVGVLALPQLAGLLSAIFGQAGYGKVPAALAVLLLRAGMLLPLGLLYFYNGRRAGGTAGAKWVFYIFYPAHLLLLGLLRKAIALYA